MTIEITNPDVEALIRQRMRAGAFKNPEDLIQAVLRFSAPETRTGADLIAALQECPYPEGDIEASATLGGVQSAADIVLEEMRKVPADIMASLPRDGASQHDHYLYGWPKKEA